MLNDWWEEPSTIHKLTIVGYNGFSMISGLGCLGWWILDLSSIFLTIPSLTVKLLVTVDQSLDTYFRYLIRAGPKLWTMWLSLAVFWCDINYNSATRLTPFQSLYSQDPLLLLIGTTVPSRVSEVHKLIAARDETLAELLTNLLKA